MEAQPLVTIGITSYNYAHFIETALESVINQNYKNIEIIIVEDCSSDNSVEVIKNWIKKNKDILPIRFILNKKNLGLAGSTDVILQNASGKYLQLLDADDFIFPDKVETQIAVLESNPDCALVYSNLRVEDVKGDLLNADYCNWINFDRNNMPEGWVLDKLIAFNFIPAHSPIFHVAYAREVGGFDPTLRLQDYYMWLKLAENYQFKYLNEVLGVYRIHSSSMSNNMITYPASADSALTLRYRYYPTANKELKKKIAKNIHFGSVFLYQQKFPTAKKWISLAFKLKPGFKTLLYYCSIRMGIPFAFFGGIKSIIRR